MEAVSDRVHELQPWVKRPLSVIGVAGAYYLAAQVDYFTKPLGHSVASLWIPAGVAVVALLLCGASVWPGVVLGSFLANLTNVPLLPSLTISVGNTLAAVCAYLLLRRSGFCLELNRMKDGLSLVFLGALTATLISSTVGTATFILAGIAPRSDYLITWFVWRMSDALGVLVVTPFLLLLRTVRLPRAATALRWAEGIGLLVATVLITAVATRTFGLLFLAFPLMVWAAARFQVAGVAPCALAVTAVAIDSAAHSYGIFAGRPLLANAMILQIFNVSIVLTGLLLAVIITQWRKSREQIEKSCTELSEALDRLGRSQPSLSDLASGLRQAQCRPRSPTIDRPRKSRET